MSEVVKLYKQDQNGNPDEYIFEWTKSRSGLAGKHFLHRDSTSYGWFYKGPINGGIEHMDNLVNALNNRANERFDRRRAADAISKFVEVATVGRLLEQARRQGLITSSWDVGPNGTRTRMYHSWDYKEPDFAAFPEPQPAVTTVEEPEDDDCLF